MPSNISMSNPNKEGVVLPEVYIAPCQTPVRNAFFEKSPLPRTSSTKLPGSPVSTSEVHCTTPVGPAQTPGETIPSPQTTGPQTPNDDIPLYENMGPQSPDDVIPSCPTHGEVPTATDQNPDVQAPKAQSCPMTPPIDLLADVIAIEQGN